jgi:energy-coupling factor transporter ATP-binding protein EcfA2
MKALEALTILLSYPAESNAYRQAYSSLVAYKLQPDTIHYFKTLFQYDVKLSAEGLSKTQIDDLLTLFRDRVKRISQKENIVWVIGEKGAGKSTVIHSLSSLMPASIEEKATATPVSGKPLTYVELPHACDHHEYECDAFTIFYAKKILERTHATIAIMGVFEFDLMNPSCLPRWFGSVAHFHAEMLAIQKLKNAPEIPLLFAVSKLSGDQAKLDCNKTMKILASQIVNAHEKVVIELNDSVSQWQNKISALTVFLNELKAYQFVVPALSA